MHNISHIISTQEIFTIFLIVIIQVYSLFSTMYHSNVKKKRKVFKIYIPHIHPKHGDMLSLAHRRNLVSPVSIWLCLKT